MEKETVKESFWDDRTRAQGILEQLNEHRYWLDKWKDLDREREEIEVLIQLGEEEDEPGVGNEITERLTALKKGIEALELEGVFQDKDDQKNAILTIHPGAGGTESADWAQMLLRMYSRWFERKGFQYRVMDLQPGEVAGIKNAVVEVKGDFAYGYLKSEIGVHRLVRISPFDAGKRRHTSFASIFVYPEIEEKDEGILINPADLRIDTFRASGHGGQHVNVTDSAVRITHLPSGVVVQCQNERSQYQNKENALKILRARLYQRKLEEERKKLADLEESKSDIAWGSQIRSYVFHPYNLVKDHRTEVETGNTKAVMDGELDEFIRDYLLMRKK